MDEPDFHTAADLEFETCLIPGCPTGLFPKATVDPKVVQFPVWLT